MFIDGFVLILAFLLSALIVRVPYSLPFIKRIIAVFVIFLITYIAAAKEKRLYNVTLFFYFDRHIRLVTSAFIMALVVTSVILLFFLNPYASIRHYYTVFLIVAYLFMLVNVIVSRLVQIVVVRYNAPRGT